MASNATNSDFPHMVTVRQTFDRPRVDDPAELVKAQLTPLLTGLDIAPGQTVAFTVGSRGIANIAIIAKAVADAIRAIDAVPIIIPAMGSHGGATAQGQRELIEAFGVTEEFTGAEIRSSMETTLVASTEQGVPIHFDSNAHACDHVLIMGRIKPHTGFVGNVESGLHKMMLIGLGKHAGALTAHRAIKDYSFETIIQSVANRVLEKCNIIGGLAIVENAYDETALIEVVRPEEFYEHESRLLKQAVAWMPSLPISEIDLLIVDRIGKNISGTGMDTNIIGRKYNDHAATERDTISCKRIYVRGLTPQTNGNATGIGLAEFTKQSVVDEIDLESTRINCITSSHPTGGMIPFTYQDDRSAMVDALKTIGLTEPQDACIVRIQDTLHLERLQISSHSTSSLPPYAEAISAPSPISFDNNGNFIDE